MADFIDEIEEIEKNQANDFLMEDDDECAAIITSPEVSPGLYEHFKITADKGQSLLRVDKFLVARLVGATRNRIQQAAVTRDGQPHLGTHPLAAEPRKLPEQFGAGRARQIDDAERVLEWQYLKRRAHRDFPLGQVLAQPADVDDGKRHSRVKPAPLVHHHVGHRVGQHVVVAPDLAPHRRGGRAYDGRHLLHEVFLEILNLLDHVVIDEKVKRRIHGHPPPVHADECIARAARHRHHRQQDEREQPS